MWSRLKTSKAATEGETLTFTRTKRISINEEYLNALRTHSYSEFFTKATKFLVTEQPSSKSCKKSAETLLEPEQDVIPSVLEALISPKSFSDLKLLMLSYFDTSAEASRMCTQLLRNINETHDNCGFIQRALEGFSDNSPEEVKFVLSKLSSFTHISNPFANPNPKDFKMIRDRYSSILQHLKLKRKQVARRTKLTEYVKKASGICLTVACSVAAVVAIGIAVHSLTGLVLGPLLLGLPPLHLKKKFQKLRYFKSRFLRKLGEQIDAAAKGTYILNRDFDTMSRLVSRLHDEVERIKYMIHFWLDRKDIFCLQEVVKELKKSGRGLKRQVEELEEHVCLCLATINRARLSVINEISPLQPEV